MTMITLAPGWQMEVERGPDWLFVRLDHLEEKFDDSPQLAEKIWDLMQQHFTNRVVLEMQALPILSSYLIGQLVLLHKRVTTHGGLMRLCGLSEETRDALRMMHLADRFPHYPDRTEAVRGHRPLQPR
jgi:anti-anti-sigma factor